MRISDWSSDVCSSDLPPLRRCEARVLTLGAHRLGDAVQQTVHESRLALFVECLGDVDIFRGDRPGPHIGPRDQFIGTAAQDLPHRLVQPPARPAGAELRPDLWVGFRAPLVNPSPPISGNSGIGIYILYVFYSRAPPRVLAYGEIAWQDRP